MHPNQNHMDDDSLLNEIPANAFHAPIAPDGFRETVYLRTIPSLRRRRWTRRAAITCGLALAYIAGALTMQIEYQSEPAAPIQAVKQTPLAPAPLVQPVEAPREVERAPLDPEQLALRLANATPDEKSWLLRSAGDQYLYNRNDLSRAILFYGQYLDSLEPAQRIRFEDGDSWLLTTLRTGRS